MEIKEQNQIEGLEPQQYQRMYWEDDVPVKDLRKGMIRKLYYFAIGLFVMILLVASIVRFPDQIELPFILKTNEPETTYKFPFPVYVDEVYKQTKDTVQAGSPLIRISSPEIVDMIYALEDSRTSTALFESHQTQMQEKQKEILKTKIRQNEILKIELLKRWNTTRKNWELLSEKLLLDWKDAQQRLHAYQNLVNEGMSSKFDLKDRELLEIKAREALNSGRSQYQLDSSRALLELKNLNLDIHNANSEIDHLELASQEQDLQLKSKLQLNQQKLLQSFGPFEISDGSIVLKASHPGMVSYMFEGEKEIKEGMTVLKISSHNSTDYAFIKCPPGIAGKIKIGQQAHLKVASFPFYEWGTLTASVSEISQSADEAGQFNLKLSIENNNKLQSLLIPGLNGTAVVLIDEKTLLQYFFRNVKKNYHRFMEG
ncbi:MAG: HlyD family efflux transporter periplasmic adaptor subunit [Saprospiraceae bacterium]|nr:HlyD family efflux transporter periplasmic adaptor subunit [Saprospiraceae bacterium]